MSNNTLYPGYMVIYYTLSGIEHKATLPCSGNLAGTQIPTANTVMQNNGTAITATQAAVNYATIIRPIFHTTVSFDRYELYSVATPASSPNFEYSDDIGLAGTNAVAPLIAGQLVAIARTANGGVAKPTYLECTVPVNSRYLSPSYGATVTLQNIAAWLKGDSGWIIGRDGGRIVQVSKFVSKTNDLLRKRRLLV